ncbi:hypothetical protein MBAV_005384 [Candidatus Magnetobacterium bavaricum]|uniref:Uncharacterized protein n=1 Tax=Candidatus Magnetobacterium bavaricum TaxID=29290 RepID=A0A0F3GKE3_9BACT|nr:hypothetical protein MBAV_005384 [Candidatus Magnetobacterium bavaricum]
MTQQFERIEVRGWKEVCRLLGVRDKRTAKKILTRLHLLRMYNRVPVVNIEAYKIASINQHLL